MVNEYQIIRYRFIKILILLFIAITIYAGDAKIIFDHITIKNGLSDGRIDCIIQDSLGFLWFGTQDGLNRFDGNNFTIFDHDVFDSTSISSNWIRCITVDQQGNLWIGTEGGGLNLYDYKTEKFTRWINQTGKSADLIDNFVRSILEDRYGVLWVGTRTGLTQFDREQNSFQTFHYEPFNLGSAPFVENVTDLLEDSENNIWIGTQDGIYQYNRKNQVVEHLLYSDNTDRISAIFEDCYGDIWIGSRYNGIRIFDRKTRAFNHYFNQVGNPISLSSNEIKDIFEDQDRNLWVATIQGGLNLFDRKTGSFRHYINDPEDPSSLSSNSARTLFQDRTGVVWIGMDGSGIDRFVKNRQKFILYNNRVGNPYNLSNNTILSICEDANGVLWLGTEGGGLNRFERGKNQCIHFTYDRNRPKSISSDQVTSLYKDSQGILWIGTKEGLNRFNDKQQSFERFYNKNTPITANNFINVILESSDGNLILGTNNGIQIFNRESGEFNHVEYDKNGILDNEVVLTLLLDRSGLLWIGYSRSGLVIFDPSDKSYIHYRSDPEKMKSLSNNFVQYIYRDKDTYIWIATRKGLNRFDQETGDFIQYSKTDGLPSNVIVGILEDYDGNLWLSTTNGLSKFNKQKETFTNYNIDDGLQGNQFWINSCFRSESGELFFGGNNGFNVFYPQQVEKLSNHHIPPIVITDVTVLDKSRHRSIYANSTGRNTLILSHQENRISFEFAALDFTNPEKNQFAYLLEGFDDDWINAGTRRYANYTNLNPGDYIFRVIGTNNDGVWNDTGTSLSIHINTPFWKTIWAYLLYIILAAVIIYGVNIYILNLVRARHDLKIERMEKEKVKELNQFKLQFFTDVAHEFKTPLTLIQAPLEEIIGSNHKTPFREEFHLMQRNVSYLLRLIHQLLSFRRVEQKKVELKVSYEDIVQFSREVFELFKEKAKKCHIDYQFKSNHDLIEGWFDWGKIEEILVNLIDNAFKYTPDDGTITLELERKDFNNTGKPGVIIHIIDTGSGISKENQEHLFERFFHAPGGHHSSQVSSGLGLALTKRLVELHHGSIAVESQEGVGSKISVTLPLERDQYSNDEIIDEMSYVSDSHHFMEYSVGNELISKKKYSAVTSDITVENESATVLIVEDNDEMREYIRKTLSLKYNVIEAVDGRDGIEKARKMMPNIIISDVIMPNVDGIQMCHTLKEDITTSHIPIILLTAQSTIESKIEGIETGADDYIEKPFHFRFLDVRIRNILASREKLRERYRRELIMEPGEVKASSADELLLVKIRNFVEEQLANATLEIIDIANEVGLSRTNLFVKLKALTGYSPNDFIKTIRLEKACQILQKTDLTVSEIAYAVGFKYPKYFSTCFHQQFSLTPSEYREKYLT